MWFFLLVIDKYNEHLMLHNWLSFSKTKQNVSNFCLFLFVCFFFHIQWAKFCSMSCAPCWFPLMQRRTGFDFPCSLKFNQDFNIICRSAKLYTCWKTWLATDCSPAAPGSPSLACCRWGSVLPPGPGGLRVEHLSLSDGVKHGMSMDLLGIWEEACLFLLRGLHMVYHCIKQLWLCSLFS